MNEFDRIATYFAPLARHSAAALGLADDAAVWQPPAGQDVVATTDTMVCGVHFLASDGAAAIAAKLLRVNLSDLAAMGARPAGFLLNTALTEAEDDAWLAAFAAGLEADIDRFGMPLLGGDSVATPGAMTLTVTALGTVPRGRALRRCGAAVGDDVYVSGTVGDAGLGLAVKLGSLAGLPDRLAAPLLARLHWPTPRLALGAALADGLASACIDVSDGLLQDLGHVARQSDVAIRIDAPALPLSEAAAELVADLPDRFPGLLVAGDDYELAFTAPPAARSALAALAQRLELPLSCIGRAESGPSGDITVLDAAGTPMEIVGRGYQHFT
ncbi:MAG: thiamine-phosphate kinase [Sneathiellaceae bacterium]